MKLAEELKNPKRNGERRLVRRFCLGAVKFADGCNRGDEPLHGRESRGE